MCSVHTPHTSHTIFHSFPTHPSSDLATLGQIGFEQRLEYAAIGSVTNLASRLCDEAKANQIVVSRRVYGMVEPWVEGRPIDDLKNRKSTRLNSSHGSNSYAVICLKKT